MAIVVIIVACHHGHCHVFTSVTTYTSVQCKRESVVYDNGAGHGLYHTEILLVEDKCIKSHTNFTIL